MRDAAGLPAMAEPTPPGLVAVRLIGLAEGAGADGVLHIAVGEESMEAVARAAGALAPELSLHVFPPWDCLPYDRAPPSREVMGRRMQTLRALLRPAEGPRLVITTPGAALQRMPPREAVLAAVLRLRVGETIDLHALRRFLLSTGYYLDERVDEPGEAAIRGQVVDLFPAGLATPYRIFHDDENRITEISAYDPLSQRSVADARTLTLGPASELISGAEAVSEDEPGRLGIDRAPGIEHRMARHYPRLETLFEALPRAAVVLEEGVEECRAALMEQIADAHEMRRSLPVGDRDAAGGSLEPPESLYLTDEEWSDHVRSRHVAGPEEHRPGAGRVPRFATEAQPTRAFADFVRAQLDNGVRLVLAAGRRDLSRRARPLQRRLVHSPVAVPDWPAALSAEPGSLLSLGLDLDRGFVVPGGETVVIAAADLLGRQARGGESGRAATPPIFELDLRPGDVVVHFDHGLGVLEGIESIESQDVQTEVVRIGYANGEMLMVPVDEVDRIWRYGSEPEAVRLDRLDSHSWEKRRAELEQALDETARGLIALAEERDRARAPRLEPPARDFERFVSRFPFTPTGDQMRAIDATLADLARDRPMDRLISGDVGYGKTEVALRAAAAAALSEFQVAMIAPTTVLARQHFETFRRRFSGFGITIGHLSGVVSSAETRAVRDGLARGEIRIVVGTHAVLSKETGFAKLGLVIVDEEQHFGTEQKRRVRALGDVHVLSMTATPIPRTLQSALAGLQDVSVIATPPVRRQPVRTVVSEFDPVSAREALLREHARGGQSFVVCPRIADISPMHERLADLAPTLDIRIAHGKMPAGKVDETMVAFAAGQGDVLLATNIIGAGLDVPRANTVLVWRADRFGLSELHQLRGRVGRGRLRGSAYLLTDPEGGEIAPATRKRLETMQALDRLGAGFAISARDLDLRGAGDLLGEEQSGHVKLIGVSLYQRMLRDALARVRGADTGRGQRPEIHLGLDARIPADYVPEPEMRLGLYARIARLVEGERLESVAAEIEDRFGRPPPEVKALLARARLQRLCRRAGVVKLDGGPDGLALTFAEGTGDAPPVRKLVKSSRGSLQWRGERLVLSRDLPTPARRLRHAVSLMERLAGG